MSTAMPTPSILKEQFLQWMRMRNSSPRTIEFWEMSIRRFLAWCEERGIDCISEITAEVLAAYRRHLFHYRNAKTQKPLKFSTQASYLVSVRRWFVWLAEQKYMTSDISQYVELPKEEKRLPTGVLTAEQVESVMNQTDITTPLGLRDRAILETFYSTGIRCSELADLQVYDLEFLRGIINIRQGKGQKDRVVPLGKRAQSWLEKYLQDIRPQLVCKTNNTTLFVSVRGNAISRNNLSAIVKDYMLAAGIDKRGSCHLLRHTAATLMMENGADLRSLQQFLGHKRLNTTQIYTHVSIKRLQDVHAKTHPAKPNRKPDEEKKTDETKTDNDTKKDERS